MAKENTQSRMKDMSSMVLPVCEYLWPRDVKLVQKSLSPIFDDHPRITELKLHPTPLFRYDIVKDRELMWKILDQLDAGSILNFASLIPALRDDKVFQDLKEWFDISPDLAELSDFWDGPYEIPSEPVFDVK